MMDRVGNSSHYLSTCSVSAIVLDNPCYVLNVTTVVSVRWLIAFCLTDEEVRC